VTEEFGVELMRSNLENTGREGKPKEKKHRGRKDIIFKKQGEDR